MIATLSVTDYESFISETLEGHAVMADLPSQPSQLYFPQPISQFNDSSLKPLEPGL